MRKMQHSKIECVIHLIAVLKRTKTLFIFSFLRTCKFCACSSHDILLSNTRVVHEDRNIQRKSIIFITSICQQLVGKPNKGGKNQQNKQIQLAEMIDKALTSTGSERKGQSLSSGLRIASVVKQELTPQRLEYHRYSG